MIFEKLSSLFRGKAPEINNLDPSKQEEHENNSIDTGNPLSKLSSNPQDKVDPEELIKKLLGNPILDDNGLGNTPLTLYLAGRVFDQSKDEYEKVSPKEILPVLAQLVDLAKTYKPAQKLVTAANSPTGSLSVHSMQSGIPSNTPLMLMVKAGDIEAVKLLLPFYNAEELMSTTPRGNSVFHIASIAGQGEILSALQKRANELGIWAVYKTHKNNSGYTAFQMLEALFTKKNSFKNLLDFSDPLLGGEEINKVPISNHGQISVFLARQDAVMFRKELEKDDEHPHPMDLTTPPSTSTEAPLVADDKGLQRKTTI